MIRIGCVALIGATLAAVPAGAQSPAGQSPAAQTSTAPAASWAEIKCARYTASWAAALAHAGPAGLGRDFLDRHRAFLESGCSGPHDVCPRSEAELALANTMVVLAMNAGTASTFPPFGCPK